MPWKNSRNGYKCIDPEFTYPFTWLMTRNPDTVRGVEKVYTAPGRSFTAFPVMAQLVLQKYPLGAVNNSVSSNMFRHASDVGWLAQADPSPPFPTTTLKRVQK